MLRFGKRERETERERRRERDKSEPTLRTLLRRIVEDRVEGPQLSQVDQNGGHFHTARIHRANDRIDESGIPELVRQ